MTYTLLTSSFFAGFFYLLFKIKSKFSLSYQVLVSLVSGVIFGFLFKCLPQQKTYLFIHDFLYLLSQGYLALLKLVVIPLILSSIINSIFNVGSSKAIRALSIYSCLFLLGMTSVASLIGLGTGQLFSVGHGLVFPITNTKPTSQYTGFVDTILGMIPSNPIAIMVNENTVAIVLLAILIGLAALMLKEQDHDAGKQIKQFISIFFAWVKKLASLILYLTPYGTFALLTLLIADQGLAVLIDMSKFIGAMYFAMFLVLIMHCTILKLAGYRPLAYLKKALLPLSVAFTTRSSFATLPITEETLRDQFKTDQTIATFVPSIGATIGMNACAGIFPAMLVSMALTILHQPLTLPLVFLVMFINAVASLGISGIPGTAYIAATVTLTSLNLPYTVIGLVQGIDPIIDMGRTMVNVNGVMTTALVVDKLKK